MFEFAGRYPLSRRTWPYVVGGLVGVLALALLADAVVSRGVRTWPEPLPWFFATITDLGDAYWILAPALKLTLLMAGLALIVRDRLANEALLEQVQLWGFVFAGVGIPSLAANLVKRVVGRGRPEFIDSLGTLSFRSLANDWRFESFPSGHAATAFAAAMVVGFLKPRWFVPALVVAVLVGVSRIAVGAHYFSDVIGGAATGVLVAYPVRHLFAWRGWLFELRADGTIVRRHFPATRAFLSGRSGTD